MTPTSCHAAHLCVCVLRVANLHARQLGWLTACFSGHASVHLKVVSASVKSLRDACASARPRMRGAARALFPCIARTCLCARIRKTANSPPRKQKDAVGLRDRGRCEVATWGAVERCAVGCCSVQRNGMRACAPDSSHPSQGDHRVHDTDHRAVMRAPPSSSIEYRI